MDVRCGWLTAKALALIGSLGARRQDYESGCGWALKVRHADHVTTKVPGEFVVDRHGAKDKWSMVVICAGVTAGCGSGFVIARMARFRVLGQRHRDATEPSTQACPMQAGQGLSNRRAAARKCGTPTASMSSTPEPCDG